jgi:hypothetical protein
MKQGMNTGKRMVVVPHLYFTLLFVVLIFLAAQSEAFASTITLHWGADTDPTITGYKVYYQADSSTQPFQGTGATQGAAPIDVKNLTTATITGLDPSHAYYFAVTAYNASGIESPYSNIASIPELVPPTVSISSPANSTKVSGTVSVNASASDNVGVTKVEFYVNGVLQATDTASPYVYSWNTSVLASGSYTLQAKAYDAAGNVGQSSIVSVTVAGSSTTPPTVSVTSPANSAVVSGTVTISATASDSVGVSRVEFYENGSLLFAGNTTPYSYSWNTTSVANGSYTLSAKAYDPSGNVGQSANINIIVSNNISTGSYIPGDLNGDGKVDLQDALLALKIAIGSLQPTAEQLRAGDVAPIINGTSHPDGVINMSDVIVILGIVTGSITL